eukprot:15266932-Ditylum_brightwellii.AAC.1
MQTLMTLDTTSRSSTHGLWTRKTQSSGKLERKGALNTKGACSRLTLLLRTKSLCWQSAKRGETG